MCTLVKSERSFGGDRETFQIQKPKTSSTNHCPHQKDLSRLFLYSRQETIRLNVHHTPFTSKPSEQMYNPGATFLPLCMTNDFNEWV